MMIHKLNNVTFKVKNKTWEYVPNNIKGIALYNGKFKVSKRVMELIGHNGVKKIDNILKGMAKSKGLIYGENSAKIGFSSRQYFATIPQNQKNRSLPYIFKNNEIIICDGECGAGIFNASPTVDNYIHKDLKDLDLLKRDGFNYKGDIEDDWRDLEPFQDYAIYTIDDTNKTFYGETVDWEWLKIQENDKKTIKSIQGSVYKSEYL